MKAGYESGEGHHRLHKNTGSCETPSNEAAGRVLQKATRRMERKRRDRKGSSAR